MRLSNLTGPLVVAALASSASCAPPSVKVKTAPNGAAAATAVTATEAPPGARGGAQKSAPPPHITAPMAGEPAGNTLAQARLVPMKCEDGEAGVKARLATMRAEVDAQFKAWHDAQPDCWRSFRQMWDEQAAGLGLMGIGEGGGGYGTGIGYGSIGTIGHGSGVGTSTRTPRVRMGAAKVTSKTNTQVAGVDEADIVKTDGRYVYLVANGALRIFEAMSPKLVSITRLGGSLRDLFVEGDRAVVFAAATGSPGRGYRKPCTYGYDCQFAGDGSSTLVTVFDISERKTPKVVRKLELSGSLMTSRRIGAAVHTVVADGDADQPLYNTWPDDLPTCGTPEKKVKEMFAALKRENARIIRKTTDSMPSLKENGVARSLCGSDVFQTARAEGKAFTTLVSFDLSDDAAPAKTTMIQSRPGAVFASADALYLSVVHQKRHGANRWYSFYPSVDEVSEVHKFGISADPKKSRYVGSGVVPGHVLNQFAMDEWYGYLRIATTRGRVPDPKVESVVSVLAESESGNLVRVGAIEKIAPGEDIRAVRFDGERGYVVTFKKTDPLFVIDLQHPAKPEILGELKIPGFSTYMHRIDKDHLLSIGFDADDKGDFAFFDGVILQLFDVSEPTEPKLIHKAKIGTRGSSSEAATNHLAFNYLAEKGLLAIPMTVCEGGGDGRQGTLAFSGLQVWDVSIEKGFAKLGGVDHGKAGVGCNTWWSRAESAVKRSVFLDDLVYSIASDRVKVQRLGELGADVADLSLVP